MKREELEKELESALKQMTNGQLLYMWNEYQECGDWRIYYMDEFDEIFCGSSPLEVARVVAFGDFNINHNYFSFDGYGNIETFAYVDEYSRFDYNELIDFLIDNDKILDEDFQIEKYLEWEVIEAIENEEITEE